jgi:hypothetical protein
MLAWLQGLSGGAATFVGSLTGSLVGLVAILLGALFNAHLNRKRDDEIRRKETRALAAAIRAELNGRARSLLSDVKRMEERPPQTTIAVPDISQSIRVLPNLTEKLGLLDGDTIEAVIDAYIVIEQFAERLIMFGGKLLPDMPDGRRSILIEANLIPTLRGGSMGVNDAIQIAIKKLDAYLV